MRNYVAAVKRAGLGIETRYRRHVNRTEAHMDHIHIGLNWRGARKRTAFWSRQHP